jgi:acetyl esterase/lipase
MASKFSARLLISACILSIASTFAHAAEPEYTRTQDVIYGRKFGTALTMDVFRPKTGANGAAIIWVMSGGWFSTHDSIPANMGVRGYTVFAVVHGSQPRFTIVDAVADMNRAVRFIRYHAKDYGIDPDRIGITGGSAGGHLSLMQGVKPAPPDEKSKDPVDHVSAKVQAVACLFPPTDFLNYGETGKIAWTTTLNWLPSAFDFQKEVETVKGNFFSKQFAPVSPEEKTQIAKDVSPIYWITADAPPTLIIHGDADNIVPIEQSRRFIEKMQEAKVEAKLEVRPGKGHGWAGMEPDKEILLDWFDQHLLKKQSASAATQPAK